MRWIWIIAIALAVAVTAAILHADRNRQKVVVGEVSNIVSMSPQLTEILFAMGLGEKIVAVSSDSDYPPEALKKLKVGTFWQPNLEAIVAIKPGLIVAEDTEQQNQITRQLKRLGYPVLSVSIMSTSELFDAIDTIAKAVKTEAVAAKLNADIKRRLIDLSGKLSTQRKFTVLWVYQTNPICVAGRESFANELIELAAGLNAIGPTVQKYPLVGIEQIIAASPEVIIQPTMGDEDIPGQKKAAVEFWSKWPNLPAVKNNRIYVISGDTVSRLSPRLDQGLEAVARCIHPAMFEPNR